ncbi:macrophage mannose receptor 1-like isoform X2 [Dreissena polymorpha]|uniref:C-type lectin domain-containing protein n=1 Tax=Dreissena polymorpha TaxID=45954 RepID=A0A9D4EJ09_DREPO|nr:macrophage mannose receptor 1-like isoform X2 [Dreissena polymorpha]KAH3780149.1 hypothetical protein DPMN_157959 [Dreissena polymorpha]
MNSLFKNYLLTFSLLIYGFGICYVCSCRSDYIKNGTRCYKHFPTQVTWEQANTTCTHDNAYLIKIDDVNEFKLLQSIQAGTGRHIWVGARRKPGMTIIKWLDGDNVSQFWDNGEPNDVREECVELYHYNYPASLNDLQCEKELPFVCEGQCRGDYTINGTICSKYFADAVSWEGANRRCKRDNSTLFKMDTRNTLSLLQSIITNNVVRRIWVGARRKSNTNEFQWINGASVSQFWKNGEPNNQGGDENCVNLGIGAGFLNDRSCSENNAFVCEAQDTSVLLTTPGVTSKGAPQNTFGLVTKRYVLLTTPGVTRKAAAHDKSDVVTKPSLLLTTPGVASDGAPEDKSDTTLLAVKIAVPLVVGLLSGALTAVVCIYLKRKKRQTSSDGDHTTAANSAASEHAYYFSPIDNECHEYETVK